MSRCGLPGPVGADRPTGAGQPLHTIARSLSGGTADARTLPWGQLRYERTTVIRAALIERYAPATANRFLAALRGTLREARRLGLTSSEDLARAVDLMPHRTAAAARSGRDGR